MATIKRVAVTLTVDEANLLIGLLHDFSATEWGQAKRTKSAAIRDYCETRGRQASHLEAVIVERMYQETR